MPEPLEVVDEVDQRLTQHVALAGQQQIDDTERILGLERVHQLRADLGRIRRAAVVSGNDLGDREPARSDERHHGDQPADDLARAALCRLVRGDHRGGWRVITRNERRRERGDRRRRQWRWFSRDGVARVEVDRVEPSSLVSTEKHPFAAIGH